MGNRCSPAKAEKLNVEMLELSVSESKCLVRSLEAEVSRLAAEARAIRSRGQHVPKEMLTELAHQHHELEVTKAAVSNATRLLAKYNRTHRQQTLTKAMNQVRSAMEQHGSAVDTDEVLEASSKRMIEEIAASDRLIADAPNQDALDRRTDQLISSILETTTATTRATSHHPTLVPAGTGVSQSLMHAEI